MKEVSCRGNGGSSYPYHHQKINLAPSLMRDDITLRKRTPPPRERSESAFHQPQTNVDKAAAADTEEYLVIQSEVMPKWGFTSMLTSKSHLRAKKNKKRKETAPATETEQRDPPPSDSIVLVRERTGFETEYSFVENTYTSFFNNPDGKVHPIEWKDFIQAVTDDEAAPLQPEPHPEPSDAVSVTKSTDASDKSKMADLKTNTPIVTPDPKNTTETAAEPDNACTTNAAESSTKSKNKLFRLFPSIADAATRRKNRMEAARERRRMLDEKKTTKKEKKVFLKRTKTPKSTKTDSSESLDKNAYVHLPASPTAGLLELAEKLKQKGLPALDTLEEEPKQVGPSKEENGPKGEVACQNDETVEVSVEGHAGFDEDIFPVEFPPNMESSGDNAKANINLVAATFEIDTEGAKTSKIDAETVEFSTVESGEEVFPSKDEGEGATLKFTIQEVEHILEKKTSATVEQPTDVLYKRSVSSIKEAIKQPVDSSNSRDFDVWQQEALPLNSRASSTLVVSADEVLPSEASGQLNQVEDWLETSKGASEDENEGFDARNSEQEQGGIVNDTKTAVADRIQVSEYTVSGDEECDGSGNHKTGELTKDDIWSEHHECYEEKDCFIDGEEALEGVESQESLEQDESFELSEKIDDDYSVLSGPDTPMAPGCNFYSKLLDRFGRWILPLGGSKGCTGDSSCVPTDDSFHDNETTPDAIGRALGSSSSSSSNTRSPKTFDSEGSVSVCTNGKPLPVVSMTVTLDDDDVFDTMEARWCGA
jgi:hypothetical protein